MPITDSNLWSRYASELTDKLMRVDPTITKSEIDQALSYIAFNVTVPITIHETTDPNIPDVKKTLYQSIDEIEASNDIISAAGVIVSQHKENLSPMVNMLINWKMERAAIKKQMYSAMDIGDNDMARYFEKLQKNLKSNKMNALYGILALVSSAFFHEYVPNAVTSTGRQLIAHSAMMFEAFLGNNLKFLSMGECIHWIDTVCEAHKNDIVDKFVIHPTYDQVYDRIVSSFVVWHGDEHNFLRRYVETLSPDELVYVYYTNNMVHFIKSHPIMLNLLEGIFSALPTDLTLMEPDEKLWKKYGDGKKLDSSSWRKMVGSKMFLNPYKPPEEIAGILSKFRGYIWKYCYTAYLPMSVVSRLNKLSRNAVAVIDTDSNMIYTPQFVELCNGICAKIDTGIRGKKLNEIISMMIIANVVDPVVVSMIATVFKAKRIDDEYLKHMVMKNEWYYAIMLISLVKKRYAGNPLIQEGLILPKLKPDIKGFDFKKAAIPKTCQKRLIGILVDRILTADDDIDVNAIVNDINQLESDIKESILAGSTEYWKIATYKDKSAYEHPERIQVYKGGTLWNQLYPDQKLESLDKACLAKLRKGAEIRGIKCDNVIAVPLTLKQVPQEIIDQLDIDVMAYNITSSFNSVLDCFNIESETLKTSSGSKIIKRKGRVDL